MKRVHVESIILQTITRLASSLIIMFSLFLFLRGHDAPGGGFIGGLMASAGILLVYIAFGLERGDHVFPYNFRAIAVFGLLSASVAGVLPMFFGRPFLTSTFYRLDLPLIGPFSFSTVLLFDLGVYLVVIGTMVKSVRVMVLERALVAKLGKKPVSNGEGDAAWRQ